MDKENKGNQYISIYEIGSTTYEVETSFSGTENLNGKIIRSMLAEKIKSKGADNSQDHYRSTKAIPKAVPFILSGRKP